MFLSNGELVTRKKLFIKQLWGFT